MYAYNQFDQTLVDQRVEQYRDQTHRYLAGEIPEDEFRTHERALYSTPCSYASSCDSIRPDEKRAITHISTNFTDL